MTEPAEDLAHRRPVWEAMSELFLDTEITDSTHSWIAGVLCDSPYSVDELERIMFDEVFPVLVSNVWAGMGEWMSFDMAVVEQRILHRQRQRLKVPSILIPGRRLVRDDWETVMRQVKDLAQSEEPPE